MMALFSACSLQAGEIKDAPFTKNVTSLEKKAIQVIMCNTEEVGTGTHLGSGLIMWGQHVRSYCPGKGQRAYFGNKPMKLLYCNVSLDFCISRLEKAKDIAKMGNDYLALSIEKPVLGDVVRSVGYPGGFSGIRSSTGALLKYYPSNYTITTSTGSFVLTNIWKMGLSSLPGSSNSPALNAKGHILVYTNSSKGMNSYTLEQVRNNPDLGAGGTEGIAIARNIVSSPLEQYFCETEYSLYGCK